MNGKRNKTNAYKLLKYLSFSLICVVFFPPNCSGKQLRFNNSSNSTELQQQPRNISIVTIEQKVDNNSKDYGVSNPAKVTGSIFIINIFVVFLASLLISLILGYLYSASIVKQGLVLFLYQDTAKHFLLLIFTSSSAIATCYFKGDGVTIQPIHAKWISFFQVNFTFC